jgi:hypothetical protein
MACKRSGVQVPYPPFDFLFDRSTSLTRSILVASGKPGESSQDGRSRSRGFGRLCLFRPKNDAFRYVLGLKSTSSKRMQV